MDTTSDDLTRPLGATAPDSAPPSSGRRVAILGAGAASVLLAVSALAYVQVYGDARGGIPSQRVEIVARPGPAVEAAPVREALRPDTPPPARRSAVEVETASGVSVVRPPGSAPPESLIVRVPDEISLALKPAPDARLADRTRFGVLPRVGPDGARPLEVYARPVTGLPGGAEPAGRVALVVGGLGIGQSATADALERLPPAVTAAFAPYGADLERSAQRARAAGREIMLQVPMEPFDYPDSDPGPRTLTTSARPAENAEHLQWAMGRLTGYVGVMNYMGGKLTADEKALAPILREIGGRGLGFLDDGSSARSLVASRKGEMPVARADVVLDAVGRADAIDKALAKLEAASRTGRVAIGSASALPLTVERIERWARDLERRGILLVPVSAALRSAPQASASQ